MGWFLEMLTGLMVSSAYTYTWSPDFLTCSAALLQLHHVDPSSISAGNPSFGIRGTSPRDIRNQMWLGIWGQK